MKIDGLHISENPAKYTKLTAADRKALYDLLIANRHTRSLLDYRFNLRLTKNRNPRRVSDYMCRGKQIFEKVFSLWFKSNEIYRLREKWWNERMKE